MSKNQFLGIAALSLFHLSSFAGEIATTRSFTPILSQGYISERQALAGECLTGTPIFEGSPEASISYASSISEQQLASELGISAGGKARFGVVQVSAAANFYNSSKSDGFSISAIYTGTYFFKNRILKNPQLKPEYKVYIDNLNVDKWREACGDEFVVQQSLGAKLFFSIRIDFLSEQEKTAFAANFSFDAPLVSANASINRAISGLSKRTKITINVLQIGGKVDKITEIFQGSNANAGNAAANSYRFVQCSSGQLAHCQQVLEQAISYATNTQTGFPSQISPNFLADPSTDGGPAVLSSTTQSYRAANIFMDLTPELDLQMKLSRQLISQKYEQTYGQYAQARRLIRQSVVRLSPNQRERLSEMESYLFLALQRITESGLRCYQYPKQCSSAYSELDEQLPNGVKLFEERAFRIEAETFAQFCYLGQSGLSKKPLANTINALLKHAQIMSPDLFVAPYDGATVDECSAAELAFLRSTSLKLDNLGIEDLRPVAVLTQLTKLSLKANALVDVCQLAQLKNLDFLDLSNNSLVDVSCLAQLGQLQELNLSDNQIENIRGFESLNALKVLDLRNNAQALRCPFSETNRCLIADFRSNNFFINIDKSTQLPRAGHATALLHDNRVLIVGGVNFGQFSPIRSEIYEPENTKFRSIGEQTLLRYHHSATTLQNGDVLIVGGFPKKASHSAEIFSAKQESFSQTSHSPQIARASHSATLLADGRVLIAGGWSNNMGIFTGIDATSTAEIYDPKTQIFTRLASMSTPRASHRASLLKDGRVLISGGFFPDGSLSSAEIFDPKTNSWKVLRSRMSKARGNHTAIILPDGRVFIAGGFNGLLALDNAEIFDPALERFTALRQKMNDARGEHEAVLLSDGRMVFFGGRSSSEKINDLDAISISGVHSSAEIYDPSSQLFTRLPQTMKAPRALTSAVQYRPDRVILIGGVGALASYSAELFEYSADWLKRR